MKMLRGMHDTLAVWWVNVHPIKTQYRFASCVCSQGQNAYGAFTSPNSVPKVLLKKEICKAYVFKREERTAQKPAFRLQGNINDRPKSLISILLIWILIFLYLFFFYWLFIYSFIYKDLLIIIIWNHTVAVFRHTRRGHQISLQMVVRHHVVAGIWTQDLWKSSLCS